MAAFLLNTLGVIASIAIPLGLEKPKIASQYTNVDLGIGAGQSGSECDSCGGNVPHIALWDVNGARIGQHSPKPSDQMQAGSQNPFAIEHTQTVPALANVQAQYVMLSMNDDDAICLSYIYVGGDSVDWSWFGDIGYTCGADWFYSDYDVGSGTNHPRCIWLDHNHSNGLRFNGISLHMPDFNGAAALANQYNEIEESLCNSTARFKMHTQILPDDEIAFFSPPLKYNSDGTDIDPDAVIDKKPTTRRRDPNLSRAVLSKRNGNIRPGHLVISNITSHSAQELCESHTSMGSDFVDLTSNLFCDMVDKELWPLCDDAIVTGCFDLDSQTMVGQAPAPAPSAGLETRDLSTGRVVPVKSYDSLERWGRA